jgi:hypothetical protein
MEILLDMSVSPSLSFLPAMYPLNTAAQSTWVRICDGPSNYRLPNRAQPAKYHQPCLTCVPVYSTEDERRVRTVVNFRMNDNRALASNGTRAQGI